MANSKSPGPGTSIFSYITDYFGRKMAHQLYTTTLGIHGLVKRPHQKIGAWRNHQHRHDIL